MPLSFNLSPRWLLYLENNSFCSQKACILAQIGEWPLPKSLASSHFAGVSPFLQVFQSDLGGVLCLKNSCKLPFWGACKSFWGFWGGAAKGPFCLVQPFQWFFFFNLNSDHFVVSCLRFAKARPTTANALLLTLSQICPKLRYYLCDCFKVLVAGEDGLPKCGWIGFQFNE